jgi:hypothetical protein
LIDSISNALSNREVSQEVLTQILLRTYLFHGGKGTNKRAKSQKKNKKTADITSAASIISLKLSFVYLTSTFAFLQMYMASTAATASTASEIIVKTIIVTLS